MDRAPQLSAAEGYFELGMAGEARREFDNLLAEERLSPAGLQLNTQLHLSAQAWENALALSRQLCDVAPEANAGYIHAAYCLHELGRTREAREFLVEGPESLRDEPVFFYNLGCYDARLGETESARAWLLRSFEMDDELRQQAKSDPDLQGVWEE
jgi:predicted Zn-dependent protease